MASAVMHRRPLADRLGARRADVALVHPSKTARINTESLGKAPHNYCVNLRETSEFRPFPVQIAFENIGDSILFRRCFTMTRLHTQRLHLSHSFH